MDATRKEESVTPYEKSEERTGRDQYYVVKHRTWYAGISQLERNLRTALNPPGWNAWCISLDTYSANLVK